jgi:FkbM family methyltransferase
MKEYEYPLNENSLIFDVGGYCGHGALNTYNIYKCKIYVFEPIKEFCDKIKGDVRVFNFGLSDTTRTASINVAGDGSSLYRKITNEFRDIKLMSLKEFLLREKINHVDLISINIEGEEYHLLPHMIKEGLTSMFDYIQIQFHNDIPDCENKRNDIRQGLSKTHTMDWCYDWIYESWKKTS